MEKLLEILIAIGDEAACHSVAGLILRHWPSHSRALHVKKAIEDSEPVPFAPRGIDKLEPKHVRLKFLGKRKAADENLDEGIARKQLKQNLEVHMAEASWVGIADVLLDVLHPLNRCHVEKGGEKAYRFGDVRLMIHVPSGSENSTGSVLEDRKGLNLTPIATTASLGDSNVEMVGAVKEKDTNIMEEQPQERSSRLRNRKPGKEDLDFVNDKKLAKVVIQYLEAFIVCEPGKKDSAISANCSVSCYDQANPCDIGHNDVYQFLTKTSNNFGAYHMGHLLLEHLASRSLICQDALVKFLDLDKMTRHWGKERTPECNLFLSELYYDLGSSSSDASKRSEFMSDTSYHLCKIIESVALDYPHYLNCNLESQGNGGVSAIGSIPQNLPSESSSLIDNISFWVRFFWLSGRLSILDGNKEKAYEEFSTSLSLLAKMKSTNSSQCSVCLPHCKVVKEITMDGVLHQINILKVDFLMEKTLVEMIEKEMYVECMALLAPLLFSAKDVHLDTLSLPSTDKEGEEITSLEISALDILLKACEKANPMDIEVYLNCHRRKLQILLTVVGIDESVAYCKSFHLRSGTKTLSYSDLEAKEISGKRCNFLVFEEVKAMSQCVSQIKNSVDSSGDSDGAAIPRRIISDIQSLLLTVMCNVAGIFLCNKCSGQVIADQTERSCFVEAAIAFCKLQHLDLMVPVKTQVDLTVVKHDLLAEYGLCCAGEDGSGEEGIFLKFATKDLLALDIKVKSNKETTDCNEQPSLDTCTKMPVSEAKLKSLGVDMVIGGKDETGAVEKHACEHLSLQSVSPHKTPDRDAVGVAGGNQDHNRSSEQPKSGEKARDQLIEGVYELTEEEKEELESKIDAALDQCFFCLYGLHIRSDASYEDDLATHRSTTRGDYQTTEQSGDVFQYILPYAKASSRTGLVKLRRVLRAIRKHFPQPPENVLAGNAIDKFLDDPDLCEDKLSKEAGSDGFLETMTKTILPPLGKLQEVQDVTGCKLWDIYGGLQ